MYREIVIPTYELILVMLTCGLIGYTIGKLIDDWRKIK